MDKTAKGADAGATASFGERFRAWWEGYDVPRPASAPAAAKRPTSSRPAEPREMPHQRGWPEARIAAAQSLFGDGMISPGGSVAILKMIKPLGLDEKMTVVELGGGLGGLARLVTRETGAYVTAFEADPALAAAGMELSVKAGLTRKAKVVPGRPDELEVRPRSVDAVLAKEALLTVADKAAVFQAIRQALKPGGQLMLTEVMLAGDPQAEAVQSWRAQEPEPPMLTTPAVTREQLEGLGMEVRICEDMTPEFCSDALAAFAGFAQRLKGTPKDDPTLAWALGECEYWSRRLAVLQSGEVRLYRLYARLPGTAK